MNKNDINNNWVEIGYKQIPQKVFDKYGVKPFEIMKRKMRKKEGQVWNLISYNDAKEEAERRGCRLPSVQEMLVLLEWYKHEKGNKANIRDNQFLGIEELSYKEFVYLEWVEGLIPYLRGGDWGNGSGGGPFTLNLDWGAGTTSTYVGFRCGRR
ncbi:MAG: hypothetical protein M1361_01150, partial [Patescibacteria group bacterium]|nr:hypothetical protein [Patescibacteria group bacterium]